MEKSNLIIIFKFKSLKKYVKKKIVYNLIRSTYYLNVFYAKEHRS